MASSSKDAGSHDIDDLARSLSSIPLPSSDQSGAKPLDGRAAHALATRLNDILGESYTARPVMRNEEGQILNELGLPVIEITEVVSPTPSPSEHISKTTLATEHVRFFALTNVERAERRREIDRILDELEEEEEELERRSIAIQQKKHSLETQSQKELALQNMARALALSTPSFQPSPEEHGTPEGSRPLGLAYEKPAKKVSFAIDESLESEPQAASDVVMGRLRKFASPRNLVDNPIKFEVVERITRHQPAADSIETEMLGDSDDEMYKAEVDSVSVDGNDFDENSDEIDELGAADEDEGVPSDLTDAVAHEYDRRRKQVEAQDGAFAGFGRIAVPIDACDEDETAVLKSADGIPRSQSFSRFKSARLARSLLSSQQGGPSSAAADRELADFIRRGKLDSSGQLVVPDDAEEEELGYRAQEVIGALRRGDPGYISSIPKPKSRSSAGENIKDAPSVSYSSSGAQNGTVRTTAGVQSVTVERVTGPDSTTPLGGSSSKSLSSRVSERRTGMTEPPQIREFSEAESLGVEPKSYTPRVSRFKAERGSR